MKLPYIQFYPGDWLSDNVSGCSLAAQGLWLRMMLVMHVSERYGYLVSNGLPLSLEFVARKCGTTVEEYQALLGELERAGVPGRTSDGIIYSRRMVRDQQKRMKASEAGRKGGNPTLKGEDKGQVKPKPRVGLKDKSVSLSVSEPKEKPKDKDGGAGAPPDPGIPGCDATAEPGGVRVLDRRKEKPPHVQFVERWAAAYEARVGEPFKADHKHYVMAKRLIDKYGGEAVVKKANTLYLLCKNRSIWFTKEGWSAFTFEKLSGQWNSILPEAQKPTSEDEFMAELRKQEAIRERIDRAVQR